MRSSYIQNNLGEVLYNNVITWRPTFAIELGVLDGYSTLWIARGLKRNFESINLNGKLHAYDLFESYAYRHGTKQAVNERLAAAGVDRFVELHKDDAFNVAQKYADRAVHFLHIDISNTGRIVRDLVNQWHPKMVHGGIICIEGGTAERDAIEWMVKYEKAPIKQEIETNEILNTKYVYATYLDFPGLTVCLKKRD